VSEIPDPLEQARESVLASIALIANDVQGLALPAAVLLEGLDAGLVAQVLARVVAVMLEVTMADGGQQLLVRLSRQAVEEE
jgi:hypothetical protein